MNEGAKAQRTGLAWFFNPKSIAVVGASATPGKLGYAFVENVLKSGYRGRVIPVNPKASEILGLPCVADAEDLPQGLDLAAILLPAERVAPVLETLARLGVKGAIVPVSGFSETGRAGARLESELKRICRETGIRVLGPNVPGFINADARLVAAFAGGPVGGGPLAILSQSGSVAYLLVREFLADGITFGRFICIGNQPDISDSEVIEYLEGEPDVRAIGFYSESIKDGRRFLEVAGRVAATKPIVVLKGGSSAAGLGAIFSHTASVSSPERIYRAAFRRAAVVEVESLRALGLVAFALAHQRPPAGDRVAVVTSLAGVGVIAADRIERAGMRVPAPAAKTRAALAAVLPPAGSARNPVDLTGDVNPAMLARATEILVEAPEFDAVLPLVMGVPGSAEFGDGAYVRALAPALEKGLRLGKALAIGWVKDEAGGRELGRVRETLHAIGVPVCTTPEEAADVILGLVRRGRLVAERTRRGPAAVAPPPAKWTKDLRRLLGDGVAVLTEHQVKELLAAAGVAVAPSHLARDAAAAARLARGIGFPVALKLQSPDAIHKSEVGGVALALTDARAVRAAFLAMARRFRKARPQGRLDGISVQPMVRDRGVELLCGISEDRQFGKYAVVGLGGTAVEVLEDVSLRLLPVTAADAFDMLSELKAAPLFDGYRGGPAIDRRALARAVARLCRLAGAPEVAELEINPLLATEKSVVALDARIRLRH